MNKASANPTLGERAAAGLLLGLVALSGPGCDSPPPPPERSVHFDLIEELAFARQRASGPAEEGEQAPRARADGETLVIPSGVRLHYWLEMPAAARIVFEGVRPQGGERGTLRVSAWPHEGEPRLLARLVGEPRRTEIDWQAPDPQVVRLTLAAGKRGAAMAIHRPAIWAEPAGRAAGEDVTLDRRQIRGLRKVRRPNVLIYLIDSLRADRLGCYGYGKSVSPAIDAFAETALVFDDATANSAWTKSAVASLFTGLWPGSHQAIAREDKLPSDAVTLAEVLREEGYATVGFSTNPSIAEEFGFDQGFDRLTLLGRDAYADEVTERAAAWLRDFDGERPFFLYVHTLDPHDPYLPPEKEFARWSPEVEVEFASRTDTLLNRLIANATRRDEAGETLVALEALYDGEIASNDRGFGQLMELLGRAGHLRDTVVIVVADHGEDFGEHGAWRHGGILSRESLRVPLLIRLPGEHRIGREPSLVQQIDILPTLLELLELEAPRPLEGRSLLPLFLGRSRPAATDPAFLYVRLTPPARVGVIWRGWKFVTLARRGAGGSSQLYDLENDPTEQRGVGKRYPVMRDFLRVMLARKLLDREFALTGEQTEIRPETERALRALGYIQ